MWELLHQIWIFLAHVLGIPAEHANGPILQPMDLCTFTIILIFAGKVFILEAVQNFTDGFGRLRKHRFQRYTWCEFAGVPQGRDPMVKESWYDEVVSRQFAVDKSSASVYAPR